MKIVTRATFVVEDGKTVPPGTEIEWKDKAEAESFIDRGLAELPLKQTAEAEAKAAAEAEAKAAKGK